MRVHALSAGLVALVSLLTAPDRALPPQDGARLRVEPTQENVVASRLAGTWVPDEALSERLGTRSKSSFTFEADPAVAEKIPAQFAEALEGKRVYLAGIVTERRDDTVRARGPFLLVELAGNMQVVSFRERDGEPFGDAESGIVSLAPARAGANDLLFLGGDFNNEPFRAFRRAGD